MPKEVTLVKNVDLVKVRTINQKIFDQIPRIDDYQVKHEDPEKYLLVGIVHEAIVIVMNRDTEHLKSIHILTYLRWKGFDETGDREAILTSSPQIFLG